MPKKLTAGPYVVANPRGLPKGSWIIKVDGKRYYEGDVFDGQAPARFLASGFVVQKGASDG